MSESILTQARLKELFDYNEETGVFTRLTKPAPNVNIGDQAGCLNNSGYIRISIDDIDYLAHRLAFLYVTGEFPENQVDHVDHDKIFNAFSNLRKVTNQENHKNKPLSSANKSGVSGVRWVESRSKWFVTISQEYLGTFSDFFEAVCARKSAEYKNNYHANHC